MINVQKLKNYLDEQEKFFIDVENVLENIYLKTNYSYCLSSLIGIFEDNGVEYLRCCASKNKLSNPNVVVKDKETKEVVSQIFYGEDFFNGIKEVELCIPVKVFDMSEEEQKNFNPEEIIEDILEDSEDLNEVETEVIER